VSLMNIVGVLVLVLVALALLAATTGLIRLRVAIAIQLGVYLLAGFLSLATGTGGGDQVMIWLPIGFLIVATVTSVIVFLVRWMQDLWRNRAKGPAQQGSPAATPHPPASAPFTTASVPLRNDSPVSSAHRRPEPTSGSRVFISHSSKDLAAAETICTALENRGLTCWFSARDVDPGENFQQSIHRAIRAAKVMVLVFTQNANTSAEINKEIALAGQYQLAVIPVRIEDVLPNDALAYELATRQWIDLFRDWEHAIERLTTRVAAIIAAEATVVDAARP
jgi:hypothetical protein